MATRLRVAHLTTVDMSLALLLGTELTVDVEAGFEVYGISAPGPYVAQVESMGVRHAAVPSLTRAWDPRRDLAAAGELHELLRRLRPDVLHTHTPKAGVLGRVIGRLVGVPVVVGTCHGLWAAPDDAPAKRALVYTVEAMAAQFTDAELYQNEHDRRTLAWAVPARRSLTVGNGIDLARFRPDPAARAQLRGELGVDDRRLLVGGVGRRVAEKGIREFAAAARALADRARFIWVGPDDADKPDWLRVEERGVTFLGLRHDMPAVYAALDLFVLPSYREGFSRSAMEAAACGCAVVLSDIRGCREIGIDGKHVLLVPPRDAQALTVTLRHLLDNPGARRRLAANARSRARRVFDQRRLAQNSIATYLAVARRKQLGW